MSGNSWTCPHCKRPVTITFHDVTSDTLVLETDNADGTRVLTSSFTICPNIECRRFTLKIELFQAVRRTNGAYHSGELIQTWQLIPTAACKPFPDYIPQAILLDYKEACLTKDTSSKASATLSRRCIQGMIRDFWKVKPGRLVDEIKQLQGMVDPLCWQALDSIRKVGNIGAHMEHDVNLVSDIDPDEAEKLINLVEYLLEDWYVQRHEKQLRFEQVVELANNKNAGDSSSTKGS